MAHEAVTTQLSPLHPWKNPESMTREEVKRALGESGTQTSTEELVRQLYESHLAKKRKSLEPNTSIVMNPIPARVIYHSLPVADAESVTITVSKVKNGRVVTISPGMPGVATTRESPSVWVVADGEDLATTIKQALGDYRMG